MMFLYVDLSTCRLSHPKFGTGVVQNGAAVGWMMRANQCKIKLQVKTLLQEMRNSLRLDPDRGHDGSKACYAVGGLLLEHELRRNVPRSLLQTRATA